MWTYWKQIPNCVYTLQRKQPGSENFHLLISTRFSCTDQRSVWCSLASLFLSQGSEEVELGVVNVPVHLYPTPRCFTSLPAHTLVSTLEGIQANRQTDMHQLNCLRLIPRIVANYFLLPFELSVEIQLSGHQCTLRDWGGDEGGSRIRRAERESVNKESTRSGCEIEEIYTDA